MITKETDQPSNNPVKIEVDEKRRSLDKKRQNKKKSIGLRSQSDEEVERMKIKITKQDQDQVERQ